MNRLTLPIAAALMLSAASIVTTPLAFAQDNPDKKSGPSMQERGPANDSAGKPEGNQRGTDKDKSSSSSSPKKSDDTADKRSKDEPSGKKSADKADDRGQGERKSSASRDEDRKSGASDEKSDKDKAAQSETKKPTEQKADKQEPASKTESTAGTEKADKSKDSSGKQAAGDREKADKVRSADLSGDKKDRVKTALRSENVKRITNVNIDINVGRRLPRDWDYRPVPRVVIDIVPEYRGYHFVYVEDRYVIVDPDTYEVVYVLEDTGGSSVGRSTGESGSGGKCSTDLTFSAEDRTFIIEKVRHSHSIKIGELRVGATLPGDVELETFPGEVTTRVSKLDRCRYVVVEDRVAVVDPDDDRIVAILE